MSNQAFSKIWIIVIVLIIALFSVAVIIEYQKISGAITRADQLTEKEKYNEAIKELELLQQRWIVKNLTIKKQRIDQEIEKNKQLLEDQKNYTAGIKKIEEKEWNKAKELLLSISERSPYYPEAKDKIEILKEVLDCQYRKGEYRMRVFDSQGRVTGIVNGELKEEIPGSMLVYSEEDKTHTVVIFAPRDAYTYEFYAVKAGNYQFTLVFVVEGEITEFYLENIPILVGATHRVRVDGEALKKGRIGGILLIDADSDGQFEEEITFVKKLTCEEFIIRTKMPEIEFRVPEIKAPELQKMEAQLSPEAIEMRPAELKTYKNEKYDFVIEYFTDKLAIENDYETKRLTNNPRLLFDVFFYDSDYGINIAKTKSIPVLTIEVFECPEEDFNKCYRQIICGPRRYIIGTIASSYGSSYFRIDGLLTNSLSFAWNSQEKMQGHMVIKDQLLYVILGRIGSKDFKSFPEDIFNQALSTFKFIEVEKGEIKAPDLVIEDVVFSPTNPLAGDTITIQIKIKNIGNKIAPSSEIRAIDQRGWGNRGTIKDLNPNEEVVIILKIFAKSIHAEYNPHVFIIKADPNNLIDELNENNNEKETTITVSKAGNLKYTQTPYINVFSQMLSTFRFLE